jgi:hypothetical protein
VGLLTLIGMRLRRVPPATVITARISAVKAGLDISINELEAHYLAGGNVVRVVNAMISADKANIVMPFKRAAAIDLAGRDVLEAVKMSVIPKVIETPRIAAVARDGIQLIAVSRVTVRTNIERLVGGAGEETIIARVGEGMVSTIGSAATHKDVLENPDHISKHILNRGLDAGTAYEILPAPPGGAVRARSAAQRRGGVAAPASRARVATARRRDGGGRARSRRRSDAAPRCGCTRADATRRACSPLPARRRAAGAGGAAAGARPRASRERGRPPRLRHDGGARAVPGARALHVRSGGRRTGAGPARREHDRLAPGPPARSPMNRRNSSTSDGGTSRGQSLPDTFAPHVVMAPGWRVGAPSARLPGSGAPTRKDQLDASRSRTLSRSRATSSAYELVWMIELNCVR